MFIDIPPYVNEWMRILETDISFYHWGLTLTNAGNELWNEDVKRDELVRESFKGYLKHDRSTFKISKTS